MIEKGKEWLTDRHLNQIFPAVALDSAGTSSLRSGDDFHLPAEVRPI